MLRQIKKLSEKIGIDGALVFTILSRVIQAAGALVSIIFIASYLSKNEQGFYYTFASIIAIQVFFELGLTGIITQYTAHEFAHLSWADDDVLTGEAHYQSRLSSLLRFCIKWFGIIAILLFFLLLGIGFYFFSAFSKDPGIEWKTPWVILCVATSLNLFIDPVLAFFDGLGEVKDMAKVRLLQKTINVVLLFIFLALGFKLYSSALASLVSISVNYIQIGLTGRKKRLISIWKVKGEWVINYITEIFPFQWRIALSWISGYFIFQLFNPVLFAFGGAIVAGQMGMSLQVLTGISNLSMSWITTKVPLFSSLIALKKYAELDTVFNRTLKNLMLINTLLVFLFALFYGIIVYYKIPFALRFLAPVPLAMLCLITISSQLVFSWATYLRCHKKEPFLANSVIIGVLCCISTFCLGKYLGVMGVVSGYALLSIFISLPWAYYIFKTKRQLWHN